VLPLVWGGLRAAAPDAGRSPALTIGGSAPPDPGTGGCMAQATHHAELALRVNGVEHRVEVDTRATLLDVLREQLALTGTKKGCDQGQCGACTVLLDGRRANACLVLSVTLDGVAITTIEGLADGDALHPLQTAFIERDAFQCGYCTPGQICSAVAMIEEAQQGWPSAVTPDLAAPSALDDAEIRERMSGNLCRCGAYANIVPAIADVAR
jgi:xanthine dehydrogenase YagT iron-sulfur-binding subunit